MASNCDYTINGKTYSEKDFKILLLEGELDNLIKESFPNIVAKSSSEGKEKIRISAEEAEALDEKAKQEVELANQLAADLDEKVKKEESGARGITHAETAEIRDEFGLGEYEKKTKTDEELESEADDLIKKGFNIGNLLSKIENDNYLPTDVENEALKKYIPLLEKEVRDNPSDENIAFINRVAKALDIASTIEGRSFRARKGLAIPEDSLMGFFLREQEETGSDILTKGQKITAEKEWSDIKEARDKFEKWMAEEQTKLAQRDAALTVEEMKKKSGKKTLKDLSEERKQIIDDIISKFQNDKNVSFLGAGKLAEIAPDVLKLARNLVDSGIKTLEEVVNNIHASLKTGLPELEKNEINAIIAGRYNEKKLTKNELTEKWRDIRDEADLVEKLEALEKGEVPKTEKAEQERNRQITDLRKQIKDHNLTKLSEAKKRLREQARKIREQLDKGDFAKPEKKEIIWDSEGRKLQKDLIDLQKKREVRLLKQRYDRRSNREKAMDKVAEVANIPRSLMASIDFSAPLNQAFVATIAYPKIAKESAAKMFQSAFSQASFDEWFYDLKEQPRYDLMKELKLRISDPHSPFLTAREEAFMSGYAEQIPGIGKLVQGSERAYVQYLNKMRVDIFNKFVDKFEENGKTFANNKKLYEKTAKYVNNITGAGDLGSLEQYAPIFNGLFFSPRLMASRLRLLSPLYFATLPKELKVAYAKDMGSSFALASGILGSFYLYGKTQSDDDEDKISVEVDPRSSDFGKIKQRNTRWNPWGGFQPYFRLMAQIGFGQRKSSNTGIIQELSGDDAFGTTGGDVATSFVRGKLSPVPAMIWDFTSGKNMIGEKVTLKKELIEHLTPLSVGGIIESWSDFGAKSLLNVAPPSIFGIGTQTYKPREKEIKNTITYSDKDKKGKAVQVKVKLTDDQYEDFEKKSREYLDKDVKKLEALPEYKALPIEEQVALKSIIENASVKKAEKDIVKKYRRDFKNDEEAEEKRKKKEIRDKIKEKVLKP